LHKGPWIPLTVWIPIDKDGRWGKTVELEPNKELQSTVSKVKWPTREFNVFYSPEYPDKGKR